MIEYVTNKLLHKENSDHTAPKGSIFFSLFSFYIFLRRVLWNINYMHVFYKTYIKVKEIRRLMRGPVIDGCKK